MPAKLRPPPPQLFKKLGGLPYELDQLQRNIDKATRAARSNAENRAVTVESVTVPASGSFRVNHKLGRKPRNCQPVRIRSGAPAFTEGNHTTRHLNLVSTAAGTIDLKVW
jgi:hypothetical protein